MTDAHGVPSLSSCCDFGKAVQCKPRGEGCTGPVGVLDRRTALFQTRKSSEIPCMPSLPAQRNIQSTRRSTAPCLLGLRPRAWDSNSSSGRSSSVFTPDLCPSIPSTGARSGGPTTAVCYLFAAFRPTSTASHSACTQRWRSSSWKTGQMCLPPPMTLLPTLLSSRYV